MRSLIVVALLVLAGACASELGSQVRARTYPRELRYVTVGEVHSTMLELARGVANIDRVLAAPDVEEPARSAAVVEQLQRMQVAAHAIDPGAARSSHPDLEAYLGGFLAELRAAEDAAAGSPPRYYLAGTIVGACASCHAR